jgi:hypothetical protein
MDYFLDQNQAAYHFDRKAVAEKNLNESNPGIGLEREDGDWRQMVGVYKNSDRKNSVYGLVGYTPVHAGGFSAGVFGGGVTGYETPVQPAGGLLMTYQGKNMGVNLTAIPNVPSKNVYGFIGLQLRYAMEDFLKGN